MVIYVVTLRNTGDVSEPAYIYFVESVDATDYKVFFKI